MNGYTVTSYLMGAIAVYVVPFIIASGIARFGFPLPPFGRRVGCIDGLRALLALSVLFHHSIVWEQIVINGDIWRAPSNYFCNNLGAGGVTLFFMTTGLLFYPRVLAGFRASPWPSLYIGRLFRIEPLLILSVTLVVTIIMARTGRKFDHAFPQAAATWIAARGEPPLLGYPDSGQLNAYVLWSLWYEWQFYIIVLPACALVTDLARGRIPSWVLPVVLLLGSLAARSFQLPVPMLTYLPLFAIGMIAHECQRREWIVRSLSSSLVAIASAVGLALAMIFFPTPYGFGLPFFAVFFASIACGNSLWGLLRTPGALVLGECSYGIYLLHGICLSVIFIDLPRVFHWPILGLFAAKMAFAAVLVTLISPGTYLLLERPGITLGHWIGRRLSHNQKPTNQTESTKAIA